MYRTLCLASAAIGCLVATTAAAQDGLIGTWQDPKDSVHVRTQPCGNAICGVVIWATDQAKERARRGGTQQLWLVEIADEVVIMIGRKRRLQAS